MMIKNIYEFRGSSSKHLERFMRSKHSTVHELIENYRSKDNLVKFSNQLVKQISYRLKETPIIAHQNIDGNIKIVRYHSRNLITPLVDDVISTDLTGTNCIMTNSNEEALQVTGLLLNNGYPA